MDKKTKAILILGAVLVGGYLALRWWENRQGGGGGQLGTNLNSVAPALIAGSTGPQSGLNYYAGNTTLYVTEQVTQAAKGAAIGTPGGPVQHKLVPPFWGMR